MKINVSRETILHETQFCVIGGGMAGLSAAIAAARKGTKTLLVQDRPMLGGNASSEVRMWVRGAHGENNKETGIVSEVDLENIYRNPSMNFSLWDSVLFTAAKREPNLTVLYNTTCLDAKTENGRITEISCWQLTTYTFHTIRADLYADCSGDSILAPLTGARWTKGREAKAEYNETIPPDKADLRTMGNSCMIQARQTDHKVDFKPPEWIKTLTDEDFNVRTHSMTDKDHNFWWIELGGMGDTLGGAENDRDKLLAIALGVWDHIKNRGDHAADNWALEWLGFLPGKRESRRYIGAHVLTENDILKAGAHFNDVVAYGGWTMDDHDPEGFEHYGEPTIYHPAPSPYGIPFRSLYSSDVPNLLFAGRNISATHAALSSTRVMATCAVMGQAVGNAAALCAKYSVLPTEISASHIKELQNELLYDGCYLPGLTREIPACTLQAVSNLTEDEKTELFSGMERPKGGKNYVSRETNGYIEYNFIQPVDGTVRLALDLDFSRKSVSANPQHQRYSMRSNVYLDLEPLKMPANLAKKLTVTAAYADGSTKTLFETDENYRHLLWLPTNGKVTAIRATFGGAWQSDETRIFSFDLVER